MQARALIVVVGLFLGACRPTLSDSSPSQRTSDAGHEQPVRPIPLAGKLARRSAEISGLACYGNNLIILPQYPDRFSSKGDGCIFTISKEKILAYLDGRSDGRIIPRQIIFIAPGVKEQIEGFEEYEAIAFQGNRVYMTIESKPGEQMLGYLVRRHIITDATAPDMQGRFWIINFFFPGDSAKLKPARDTLVVKYGAGLTHSRFAIVERLVELQYTGTHIVRTNRAPIQLELLDDEHARNWEGVARLNQEGFLLMTDRYPKTILAFVPAT